MTSFKSVSPERLAHDCTGFSRGRPGLSLDAGGRSHAVVDAGTELEVTGATRKAKAVRTAYVETFFDAISGEIGWGLGGVDDPGPR